MDASKWHSKPLSKRVNLSVKQLFNSLKNNLIFETANTQSSQYIIILHSPQQTPQKFVWASHSLK